jgi:hypothetical protein
VQVNRVISLTTSSALLPEGRLLAQQLIRPDGELKSMKGYSVAPGKIEYYDLLQVI